MSFLFRFHDIIGGIHVPVDDGVDKLNRKYTLLVFLFLALPIFTKQYIGEPIECFAPVYFAEHQSRYINSYCWTQSTYYMVPVGDPEDDGDQQEPPDRIMPDEMDYFIGFETVTHIGNERLRRVRVSYYQWAPLILLVQGLCFYIPFLIWNSCAHNGGVKLRRLLKKASDIASLPPGCQQREALLAEFVDQFHTLVTGEAGWCVDVPCAQAVAGASNYGTGGNAGNNNGGSTASSNVSSVSNSTNNSAAAAAAHQQQHAGGHQHGNRGGAGSNARHHNATGGTNNRSNANDSHHGGNRSHHAAAAAAAAAARNGDNDDAASTSGVATSACCFSWPIIGSLLCCLRPFFNLVGPSKYLCMLYLFVKFCYVFNVGLQFMLLGSFLGRGYLRHGFELINRLILSGDWWASPRFPLSTLCQVRADMSGGLRSYTCQCVLPINVFNEKIFSVVWFYMAFLMPLNVCSLFYWIYRTMESNRLEYIRLCLWRTRLVELNTIHRAVRRLSQSYLGWDGVFLLRLIEHNHGSIMATLIMSRLWEFYANQMKLQEDANQLQLANNAHNTLSQTTTAFNSQQHQQLIAAAQAAAVAQAQHGGGGGGNAGVPAIGGHTPHQHHSHSHAGGHSHGGNHHGGGAGGGHPALHAQSHHPPPPPPPQLAGATSQQQAALSAAFAAAASGHGGPHAHHSGQVSAPGHLALHSANTHNPLTSGTNFSSQTSANLLAHLQQAAAAAAANQQANAAGMQGNVSAVLACLAPKAAQGFSSQQAPGAHSTSAVGSAAQHQQLSNSGGGSGGGGAKSASGNVLASLHSALNSVALAAAQQQQQSPPAAAQSGSAAPSAQQQQQSLSTSSSSQQATALSSAAAAVASALKSGAAQQANSAQLQHHSHVAVAAAAHAAAAAAAAASLQPATSAASAATTSFITASTAPTVGGPPLPPPPPPHVVAAVAAANGAAAAPQQSSGSSHRLVGGSNSATSAAAVANQRSNNQQSAGGNAAATGRR